MMLDKLTVTRQEMRRDWPVSVVRGMNAKYGKGPRWPMWQVVEHLGVHWKADKYNDLFEGWKAKLQMGGDNWSAAYHNWQKAIDSATSYSQAEGYSNNRKAAQQWLVEQLKNR